MSFFLKYKILPEKRVILGYASGHLQWKDIIMKKAEVGRDPLFDPSFNMLDDIRDAHILISEPAEVKKFYEFASSQKSYLGERNTALLTNTPNQVANSELLKMFGQHTPIHFETFSTLEGAMNWVGLSPNDLGIVQTEFALLKADPANVFS
jgi:hypothetical protein